MMPAKKTGEVFSAEEKAAMKEYVAEKKRAKKGGDGEADLLEKIAAMPEPDRGMATRVHALVKETALGWKARTWYGMPAWGPAGEVVCFFQSSGKFKTRYSTLGFSDKAKLDEGEMWGTAFALKELTAEGEGRVRELVRKAAGGG